MMKLYHIILKTTIVAVASVAAVSCSSLSDEAKEIVGNYYITEVSPDLPLMELRDDGSCTVRAIRPEVLVYSVDGSWNVERDSLLITLDPATLEWEGDSTLIGDIPLTHNKKLLGHTELSVELESNGINYVYTRRQ